MQIRSFHTPSDIHQQDVGEAVRFKTDIDPLIECFKQHGRSVRLARHQKLGIDPKHPDKLFLVSCGLVHVGASLGTGRLLLGLCRGGDIIGANCLMSLPTIEARAAEPTELLEMSMSEVEALCPTAADTGLRLRELRRTEDLARHALMLGRMSGDERLAYFLFHEAQRDTSAETTRLELDLGMSRSDIADYLALNPDTLSRIMARFRRTGVILASSRRTITVDLERLQELMPIGVGSSRL